MSPVLCWLGWHRWVDLDWWDDWLPRRPGCSRCGREKGR